jgi:hypothetical protein
MIPAENDKPGGKDGSPAASPAGSGEGAETALQAMIKKRKLRAEDDSPSASSDGDEPDALATP